MWQQSLRALLEVPPAARTHEMHRRVMALMQPMAGRIEALRSMQDRCCGLCELAAAMHERHPAALPWALPLAVAAPPPRRGVGDGGGEGRQWDFCFAALHTLRTAHPYALRGGEVLHALAVREVVPRLGAHGDTALPALAELAASALDALRAAPSGEKQNYGSGAGADVGEEGEVAGAARLHRVVDVAIDSLLSSAGVASWMSAVSLLARQTTTAASLANGEHCEVAIAQLGRWLPRVRTRSRPAAAALVRTALSHGAATAAAAAARGRGGGGAAAAAAPGDPNIQGWLRESGGGGGAPQASTASAARGVFAEVGIELVDKEVHRASPEFHQLISQLLLVGQWRLPRVVYKGQRVSDWRRAAEILGELRRRRASEIAAQARGSKRGSGGDGAAAGEVVVQPLHFAVVVRNGAWITALAVHAAAASYFTGTRAPAHASRVAAGSALRCAAVENREKYFLWIARHLAHERAKAAVPERVLMGFIRASGLLDGPAKGEGEGSRTAARRRAMLAALTPAQCAALMAAQDS